MATTLRTMCDEPCSSFTPALPSYQISSRDYSRTNRWIQANHSSRGDSSLRGCSIVPFLPLTPRRQRFRPVSAAASTSAPVIVNRSLGRSENWIVARRQRNKIGVSRNRPPSTQKNLPPDHDAPTWAKVISAPGTGLPYNFSCLAVTEGASCSFRTYGY